MEKYVVMFFEQDYACNANELRCSDSGRRLMFTVEADKIYDAYYKAVELARQKTKNLVRLNFCMRRDYFLDKSRFDKENNFNGI